MSTEQDRMQTVTSNGFESLDIVARNALVRSSSYRQPVRLEFNGVSVVVAPDSDLETVTMDYDFARWTYYMGNKAKGAYKNAVGESSTPSISHTPLETAANEALENAMRLQAVSALYACLDAALRTEPATVRWLSHFATAARPLRDNPLVKDLFSHIAGKLEKAGYDRADARELPVSASTPTPTAVARTIAGHAIASLRDGRSPHAKSTPDFAAYYEHLRKEQLRKQKLHPHGLGLRA